MPVSTMDALTRKGQATRRTIEAAARRLFVDRGYLRTTVADIAEGSNLSTAAFYRYFDSKDDLLRSLAESLAEQVFQLAPWAMPASGAREYFTAATSAYYEVYRANAGVYVGLFQMSMVDEHAREVWLSIREQGIGSIEKGLRSAAKDGYEPVKNPRVTAEALSSMFEHACFMWVGAGGSPRDEADSVEALADAWFRICCFPAGR